jgi:hypothetical protein
VPEPELEPELESGLVTRDGALSPPADLSSAILY